MRPPRARQITIEAAFAIFWAMAIHAVLQFYGGEGAAENPRELKAAVERIEQSRAEVLLGVRGRKEPGL